MVDAKTHERETMLTLASTASSETKELIKQVLEVSDGTRKLQSIDGVLAIHDVEVDITYTRLLIVSFLIDLAMILAVDSSSFHIP